MKGSGGKYPEGNQSESFGILGIGCRWGGSPVGTAQIAAAPMRLCLHPHPSRYDHSIVPPDTWNKAKYLPPFE